MFLKEKTNKGHVETRIRQFYRVTKTNVRIRSEMNQLASEFQEYNTVMAMIYKARPDAFVKTPALISLPISLLEYD